MNPRRDWKTTLAAIPLLGLFVLLGLKAVTTQEALMILAGAGAYLATVACDSKSPPTAPS